MEPSRRIKIDFVCRFSYCINHRKFVLFSLQGDERQLEPIFFGLALLSVSVFIIIAWKWGNRHSSLLGVTAILYLTLFNLTDMDGLSLPSESMSGWMNALGALAYLAIPGITIPLIATLTANALALFPTPDGSRSVAWSPIIGRLILIILLFGYLLIHFGGFGYGMK
jgi:hypothetical protein